MLNNLEKRILLWVISLICGTALAYGFLSLLPLWSHYLEIRHFKIETEGLAALIQRYAQTHAGYGELSIEAFESSELPKGLYKHIDDIHLESIHEGVIHIQGSSSSRYESNKNAFTINWIGLGNKECLALASQNWKDVSGLRLIGFAVSETGDLTQSETNLYTDCDNAEYQTGFSACMKDHKIHADESAINKSCKCKDRQCSFTLKYM